MEKFGIKSLEKSLLLKATLSSLILTISLEASDAIESTIGVSLKDLSQLPKSIDHALEHLHKLDPKIKSYQEDTKLAFGTLFSQNEDLNETVSVPKDIRLVYYDGGKNIEYIHPINQAARDIKNLSEAPARYVNKQFKEFFGENVYSNVKMQGDLYTANFGYKF